MSNPVSNITSGYRRIEPSILLRRVLIKVLMFSSPILLLAAVICLIEYRSPAGTKTLNHLIDSADRLVVYQIPMQLARLDGTTEPPQEPFVVFESTKREDFDELKKAARVDLFYHTGCDNPFHSPQIKLYKNEKLICTIINLYGCGFICEEAWVNPVNVSDPGAWGEWFYKRDIDIYGYDVGRLQ